jgi:outer membrane lipoprotein-sorting protein
VSAWIALSVFAASLCSIGSADQAKEAPLTAEQILQRMAETYASCKSYRDSGIVSIVFIDAGGKRTEEKPFTTAFIRPDRFRFEYTESKGDRERYRYIVWRKGNDVRTWWDVIPGVRQLQSLGLALAGATGVSGGSAHTVPALLLPDEVGGRRLTDVTEARRVKDAKLGKVECFRIQCKYADSPMTLWIEAKTFLVRRIDEQTNFGSFRTEETTTYRPVMNEQIPDKMLEFGPPEHN